MVCFEQGIAQVYDRIGFKEIRGMGTIKYNKLVRDKIPAIIEKSGKKAIIEVLDNKAYKKYLDIKLGEELQEYLTADSVDELADLVEVVYAILKYKGIDIKDFETIRNRKAEERGIFDKKLLLKEVIEE
ncbi:MAG TPA: nucleoside triphosphate pyrophosphohydrolase [Acetivibrio clariflavus]|nr:nucleoside triphosphate pyrophosphohydrolase [Acetivibrio clariflavus]